MQIVVNSRLLLKNKLEGIGWFSYQTLKRITQNQKDVHFVFLFDRPFDEEFIFSDNITPLILSPQARHPVLYYWYFQHSVKNVLNRLQPDLFLSPDGFLSLGATCKQLPVIHDINFLHHPEDSKWLTAKYYNYYFPKYARVAKRIATVSEYSKNDISSQYGVSKALIDVVYNGINPEFKPLSATEREQVKQTYANGRNFFLHVGALHPRKNATRLILAFNRYKAQTGAAEKLIFAGPNFWGSEEIRKAYENSAYKNDILFLGRVTPGVLAQLMGGALALCLVSYYEGFGIPLIESMHSGTPVICSNTTCMPEIAGNAALLVDPFNEIAIAENMQVIASDAELRKKLIEKGFLQSAKFSWDRSAALLWESINKAIDVNVSRDPR